MEGMKNLDQGKMIQISMDGPNVNWKVLRLYREKYESLDENPKLLQTGSCGLHVNHGAYKTGCKASGWELEKLFRAAYYLFNESAVRRTKFTEITKSENFPLKFCGCRWLENLPVISRLLEILPKLKEFVEKVKPKPTTSQFQDLSLFLPDPFLRAKLEFAKSVAILFEPFLKKFQSPKPLATFLYDQMTILYCNLARRILKAEVMDDVERNPKKLMEIFGGKKNAGSLATNLKEDLKVSIGTGAKNALPAKANPIAVRFFYECCKKFLVATAQKIAERSPLKFEFVKSISCLVPQRVSESVASDKMESCLRYLAKANRISNTEADRALNQFYSVQKDDTIKQKLKEFNWDVDRLDEFYSDLLSSSDNFKELWKVIKLLLILSHGNASVESGFSVNKEILTENMKENSLKGQRMVHDYLAKLENGFLDVEITKEMISCWRKAHSKYESYLGEQKKKDESAILAEREKKKLQKEVEEDERKKREYLEKAAEAEVQIKEKKRRLNQ